MNISSWKRATAAQETPRARGRLLSRTVVLPAALAACAFLCSGVIAATSSGDDDPSDWVTANRDDSSTHFSPLAHITPSNAQRLHVHCSFDLGEKVQFQDAPIVVDGVIFAATFRDVYAIHGDSCRLIWKHHHELPGIPAFGSIRGLGYAAGRVFAATLDGHVLALDARDGHPIWDTQVLPPGGPGYFVAAPLAADGMVFIGNAGSDVGAVGVMYALDQDSGKPRWSTSLIPTGNEPGAETWSHKPGAHLAGGGTWTSYTYDTQRHLLYVPVGNPGPDFDGDYRPGANLYTDSVVILRGTDGALIAYKQLVPHDVHDWDVSTPPTLITTRAHTALAAVVGKDGYLYELDPDLKRVLHRAATTTLFNVTAPITHEGTRFCPGTQGGTEFNPAAYSPRTNLLYANSVDWCSTVKLAEKTQYVAGQPFIGSSNGFGTLDPIARASGWLTAVNADTGRVAWKWHASTPLLAAVVPTGGNVLFTGDVAGDFLAFDARSGKELYRHRLSGAFAGGLAVYAVDGKELVAAVTGYPGGIWQVPMVDDDHIVVLGL